MTFSHHLATTRNSVMCYSTWQWLGPCTLLPALTLHIIQQCIAGSFSLWLVVLPLQGLSPLRTWPIFSLDLRFTVASHPREGNAGDLKETGGHFKQSSRWDRRTDVTQREFLCVTKTHLRLDLEMSAQTKSSNWEKQNWWNLGSVIVHQ